MGIVVAGGWWRIFELVEQMSNEYKWVCGMKSIGNVLLPLKSIHIYDRSVHAFSVQTACWLLVLHRVQNKREKRENEKTSADIRENAIKLQMVMRFLSSSVAICCCCAPAAVLIVLTRYYTHSRQLWCVHNGPAVGLAGRGYKVVTNWYSLLVNIIILAA